MICELSAVKKHKGKSMHQDPAAVRSLAHGRGAIWAGKLAYRGIGDEGCRMNWRSSQGLTRQVIELGLYLKTKIFS